VRHFARPTGNPAGTPTYQTIDTRPSSHPDKRALMTWKLLVSLTTAAGLFSVNLALTAQEPPPPGAPPTLRVYIDCSYYCDMDYMRRELDWVSYMRDRADAQVHVLVTTQGTGGGGTRFDINFIGLREFEGKTDTLSYTASSDDTDDVRRQGLTHTIGLGLVQFAARTPLGQRLSVRQPPPGGGPGGPPPGGPQQPENDPWNFWTFTLSLSGYGNGESASSSYNLNGSVTANRTTEAWKINTRLRGSQRQSTYEYDVEDVHYKTVSTYKNYGLSTLVVKSLGPHLSAGLNGSLTSNTYGNTSFGYSFSPAIEYNFMPYAESSRRQLTVRYSAGVRYADYREITIYGKETETRPTHALAVDYGTTQPWGRVYLSFDFSQYLHDTQKYNAGIGGSTELRLFKGFSFNIGGEYSRVHDQLSLPGRDLTPEEILLQQRQLATSYEFFVSAGISFRFGSIFNNVVNPRMGGSGGGGMMMIIG